MKVYPVIVIVLIVTLFIPIYTSAITISSQPSTDKWFGTSDNYHAINNYNLTKSENYDYKLKGGLLDFINTGVFPGYNDSVIVLSKSVSSLNGENYYRGRVGNSYIHFLSDQTPNSIRKLAMNSNVIAIYPNILMSNLEGQLPDNRIKPDSFVAKDILETQKVWDEFNITGDGVTIGVVDTGIDFGVSDLAGAAKMLTSGYTASFDPTGAGVIPVSYVVRPETTQGEEYLPLEGSNITIRIGETGETVTNYDLGISLKNLDIKEISKPSLSGNYRVGIIFETSFVENIPNQIYIFVLTDSTTAGVYDTLYIDMDTSLALTLAYNGIIFESGKTYIALADWSLSDETPYNATNPILARDITGDGINDISAGALGNSVANIGGTFGVTRGIDPQGRFITVIYDPIGHGTWSSSVAVSRGTTPYYLFDDKTTPVVENSSVRYLPGSAPGAKLVVSRGLTLQDFILGWFWIAGLEPDSTGYFTLVNKEHLVDISTNSWGDASIAADGSLRGFDLYSLLLDLMSAPDLLYLGFPGIVFAVAMGNGGPGLGSVSVPAAASMAISVGASNEFQFLDNVGKNDVAFFSNRGPTPYGIIKPDIIAPGNIGFSPHSVAEGDGNGTWAAGEFGGTSEATPRAAGVLALIFQALKENGYSTNLENIRLALKAGAVDQGFPAVMQGAGLANAYNSVSLILRNDRVVISSNYSSLIAGNRLNNAFQYLFGIQHPLLTKPLLDTFISVNETMVTNFTVNANYFNGTKVNPIVSIDRLIRYANSTFNFSGLSAKLTNISLVEKIPDWSDANFMQISLSLTKDTWNQMFTYGVDPATLYLMDKNSGKLVSYITTQRTWTQQLYSGNPSFDFQSPMIQFTDPGYINSVPNWRGLQYNATAMLYKYTSWDDMLANISDGEIRIMGNKNNLQIAYISVEGQHIPIFITPTSNVQYGDNIKDIGIVDAKQPYSLTEIYGTFDWGYRPESGDFRYYRMSVPLNATYLAIQGIWDVDGLVPDFYLFNSSGVLQKTSDVKYIGGGLYESQTSEDHAQNLFIPVNDTIYTLLVHFAQYPFSSDPTEFRLHARYLTMNKLPTPNLSFSKDITKPINGNFTISANNYHVDVFPELSINKIETMVYQGRNGTIKGKINSNDFISGIANNLGDIEAIEFLDLNAGDKVDISLNWTGIYDLDMYVFAPGGGFDVYADLLSGQGSNAGSNFEAGYFAAETTGKYIIYIDYVQAGAGYENQDLFYNIKWDARNGPVLSNKDTDINIDSTIFTNGLYGLYIKLFTNFNTEFIVIYNITLNNYSEFSGSILKPANGDEVSGDVLVSWESSVETHATIYLQYNDIYYQIARDITDNSYTFNSQVYPNGNAILNIILSNGIYEISLSVTIIINNAFPSTLSPIQTTNQSLPINLYILFILPMLAIIYQKIELRKLR